MSLVALIGLPGSGKTTVGRHLARRLDHGFLDCDLEIEARLGEPIRDFFEREGEARFRDLEEATLVETMDRIGAAATVLATGGGVVLRDANRARLRERATVVYLRSRPEDLIRRLRHDAKRPLLQVADPMQRLRELFEKRDPLYRETAHHVLEIGRPSLPGLVSAIAARLEPAPGPRP